MFSTVARNSMLQGLSKGFAGLCSTFPGQAFAGELTGGSPAYARKAVTYNAAAGGQQVSNNAPQFDVPAGGVVAWIVFADLATAGVQQASSPNGANPLEFIIDAPPTVTIKCENNGYVADQTVVFTGGTAPPPLVEGTIYYVRNPLTNSFEVSATPGGVSITLTGPADPACLVSRIVVETFAAQGLFTLNAGAILSLNY